MVDMLVSNYVIVNLENIVTVMSFEVLRDCCMYVT